MDLIDLSLMARWKIRPRLMDVPGVANVAIWGQRSEMLHVLRRAGTPGGDGITLDQLMTATADALDAGLLKFANGATSARAASSTRRNQRLADPPRPAGRRPRRPARGRRRAARRTAR